MSQLSRMNSEAMCAGSQDMESVAAPHASQEGWNHSSYQGMSRWLEQALQLGKTGPDEYSMKLYDAYYERSPKTPLNIEQKRDFFETLKQLHQPPDLFLFAQSMYLPQDQGQGSRYLSPEQVSSQFGENAALETNYYLWPGEGKRTEPEAVQPPTGRMTIAASSGSASQLAIALSEIIVSGEFADILDHAKIVGPHHQGVTKESAIIYFNKPDLSRAGKFCTRLNEKLPESSFQGAHLPPALAVLGNGVGYGEIAVNAGTRDAHGSFYADRFRLLIAVIRQIHGKLPDAGKEIWQPVLDAEISRNGYAIDEPALLATTKAPGSEGTVRPKVL